MKLCALLTITLAACTYDSEVGRSAPKVLPAAAPGHLEARWALPMGGDEQDAVAAVAMTGDGDLLVAGNTTCGAMDAAATPASPPATAVATQCADTHGYLAKRAAADGSLLWSIADDDLPIAQRVALDGAGNIYLLGTLANPSGGTAPPSSYAIAKVDQSGAPLWHSTVAVGTGLLIVDMAVSADGVVALAGGYNGTIDVGAGPEASTAGDGVLLLYGSDGTYLRGATLPGDGAQLFDGPTFTAMGELSAIAISNDGAATFDGATFGAPGERDFSLFRLGADLSFIRSNSIPDGTVFHQLDVLDNDIVIDLAPAISDAVTTMTTWVYGDDGDLAAETTQPSPFLNATALTPSGMIVGCGAPGMLTEAAPPLLDYSSVSLTGDTFVATFDENATALAGIGFSGVRSSLGAQSFFVSAIAATDSAIAFAGVMTYSLDLGSGAMWAHGSGPMDPPDANAYTTSGSDVALAVYDWVRD